MVLSSWVYSDHDEALTVGSDVVIGHPSHTASAVVALVSVSEERARRPRAKRGAELYRHHHQLILDPVEQLRIVPGPGSWLRNSPDSTVDMLMITAAGRPGASNFR